MTQLTTPTDLVLAAGEGERIVVRGNPIVVKVASPRLSVFDYAAPGGFPGPPLHVHPGFDELYAVLAGTLTLRLRDAVHEIGPGGSAFVAGAVPHTFANAAAEPVRFLSICSPGGWEDYFRALAEGDEEAAKAPAIASATSRGRRS